MKQKSKKTENIAAKIRSTVKKFLKESGGEMALSELQTKIEQNCGIHLRHDYFRNSLATRDSDIEINLDTEPVTVSPKNNPNRKEVVKVARTRKAKSKKLTPYEFTILAIEKLKDPKYEWLHVVWSHFNEAFRAYFGGLDPVTEVKKLVEAGKIRYRLAKGGAVIALPLSNSQKKGRGQLTAERTLKKMGLS